MWAAGIITADTLYWDESTQDWLPVKDLLKQKAVQHPTAPPPDVQRVAVAVRLKAQDQSPRNTPQPKATVREDITACTSFIRVLAQLLDHAIGIGLPIAVIYLLPSPQQDIGFTVCFSIGLLYLVICDGLFGGRSIGKLVFGLVVVDATTGRPAGFLRGVLRNMTFFGFFVITGAFAFVMFGGATTGKLVGWGIPIMYAESLREVVAGDGEVLLKDWLAKTRVISKAVYAALVSQTTLK